jgi:regulator of sigma E protease
MHSPAQKFLSFKSFCDISREEYFCFLWFMGGFFSSFIAFVITLFPLVLIHELGHYWMARLFGVHIEAFSIGYGPELFGWTDKRGTRWKLSPFPLGGYVQILGEREDEPTQSSVTSKMILRNPDNSLSSKAPWQKILIAAAGPLSNYLTAFLLFMGLALTLGKSTYEPILGSMKTDSFSARSGLKEGDRIISLQGERIKDFKEVSSILNNTPSDKELSFVINRPGQEHPLILKVSIDASRNHEEQITTNNRVSSKDSAGPSDAAPSIKEQDQKTKIKNPWSSALQLSPSAYYKMSGKSLPFSEALDGTWGKIYALSEMPLKMIKGGEIGGMSGPLGIAQQARVAMSEGIAGILLFMGILSTGLGLLNLLPIPMLDGGAILITLIEALLGKSLPVRLQNFIAFASIAFLGGLFLFFSWNDLIGILN